MSQRSVVESQTQSNLTPSLRSALKAALGNLDVQLDEELARYRRSRSGSQMPSARIGQRYQHKSLDLLSVGATEDRPLGDTATARPSYTPMNQPQPQEEQPQRNHQPDIPSSLSSQLALATTSPERVADLAPAPIENLGGSLLDPATNHTGPDDYLESSEALLRSLAEEQPQKRAEPDFSETLLTPLGIGSMLLLLLASATLGYVVMNPTTLTALKDHLFGKSSSPTVANPSDSTNTTSASGVPLPDSPNLANREFVDLDLDTLSSVKPRVSNIPSVVPTSVPAPRATVLPTVQSVQPTVQSTLPPMQSRGTVATTTSVPLPQALRMQSIGVGLNAPPNQTALPVRKHHQKRATRQSESAVPQPAAKYSLSPSAQPQGQSLKASNNYYYVVTNYGSDRNLEKARGVVADAYVDTSSQGALIHLGALKSEAEAQKLTEDLQKQGIQARIYRP